MAAKQEAAPRSRGRQLRADALRYGIGAAVLFALATAFWFFAHPLGVFILCVACAFAAVAAVYIALGAAAWRAFKRLGKSEAMPCAVVPFVLPCPCDPASSPAMPTCPSVTCRHNEVGNSETASGYELVTK